MKDMVALPWKYEASGVVEGIAARGERRELVGAQWPSPLGGRVDWPRWR